MMKLQQIVFCSQLERILMKKEVCLSEYDSFLIKAFKSIERNLVVADEQPITSKFVNNYKLNFLKAFREFYVIYKKIIQKWELSAYDINTLTFHDIPSIKRVLKTFDTNYYSMMRVTISPSLMCT